MSCKSKSLSILFVLLLAVSSLLVVKSACAQSIPTPSVPQFSLKFVDNSYNVPATAEPTTDPYTNKTTITAIPGYHVENLTIEVTIKNQPFPSTIDGNATSLYYDVQIKPHFGEDWTDQYPYSGPSSIHFPTQSNSEYTVLSFPASYAAGDQVDFQVQAILGYIYMGWLSSSNPSVDVPVPYPYFESQASGWSPTQTFIMPNTSASPSTATTPTPTATPTVPELSWSVILPLLASMLCVAVIVKLRKRALAPQP